MKINAFSAFIMAVAQPKSKYAVIGGLTAAVTAVAAKYIVNTKETIQSLQKQVRQLEANQRPMPLIIGNGNAKGLRPSRR